MQTKNFFYVAFALFLLSSCVTIVPPQNSQPAAPQASATSPRPATARPVTTLQGTKVTSKKTNPTSVVKDAPTRKPDTVRVTAPPTATRPPTQVPTPKPNGYKLTLMITELTCEDAEEDDYWFSSDEDELYMLYSFYEVNSSGKMGKSAVATWGIRDVSRGDSYDVKSFKQLSLNIPIESGVGVSVALTDTENYDAAESFIGKVNKIAGVAVDVAPVLTVDPTTLSVLGTIETVTTVAKVGVKVVDMLDKDDKLGEKKETISSSTLKTLADSHQLRIKRWHIDGSNNTDDYSYYVEYTLSAQKTYPTK